MITLKKYKVTYVPQKILHDYSGMNYHAAKAMGFRPCPKRNEIFVSKSLTGGSREEVTKHEMVEDTLMGRGYKYFPAHLRALKEQERTKRQILNDLYQKKKKHIHKFS